MLRRTAESGAETMRNHTESYGIARNRTTNHSVGVYFPMRFCTLGHGIAATISIPHNINKEK